MIVKSMSRKAPSFSQLLEYIAGEGRGVGEPLLHNLSGNGHDLAAVNRAFMANAGFAPARKNGIALYHEVISLSGRDAAGPAMLYDLAAHYLAQRAPQALAYGVVHTDGPHPHIHLVISANLRGRSKKLRLSRARFAAVKRELEAYQRTRYPQLTHSIVFTEGERPQHEPVKQAATRAEGEMQRRRQREGGKRQTTKEFLARALADTLLIAASEGEFRTRLQHFAIAPYERGGRFAGVLYEGKKYRLRTIGLSDAALEQAERMWKVTPSRLRGLADMLAEKARTLFRGYGYAEQMLAVLDRSLSPSLPPAALERVASLHQLAREKHARQREALGRQRFPGYQR